MMFLSNRGQVAETLNWFFVFIVVFFVMAVFIAVTITISTKKMATFSNDKKTVEGFELEPLDSRETLFAYLQSPQEGSKTMQESLFSYYDIFFKYGITDLNKIGIINPGAELQYAIKESKPISDKIFLNSQKILNTGCSDYLLVLPQGAISSKKNGFFPKEDLDNVDWKEIFIADWRNWASINLTYRDSVFEIKYRQLKKC